MTKRDEALEALSTQLENSLESRNWGEVESVMNELERIASLESGGGEGGVSTTQMSARELFDWGIGLSNEVLGQLSVQELNNLSHLAFTVDRQRQDDARLTQSPQPKTWREFMATAPKFGQRQDSTMEQLSDLRDVANKLGFYDAADLLKGQLTQAAQSPQMVRRWEAIAAFRHGMDEGWFTASDWRLIDAGIEGMIARLQLPQPAKIEGKGLSEEDAHRITEMGTEENNGYLWKHVETGETHEQLAEFFSAEEIDLIVLERARRAASSPTGQTGNAGVEFDRWWNRNRDRFPNWSIKAAREAFHAGLSLQSHPHEPSSGATGNAGVVIEQDLFAELMDMTGHMRSKRGFRAHQRLSESLPTPDTSKIDAAVEDLFIITMSGFQNNKIKPQDELSLIHQWEVLTGKDYLKRRDALKSRPADGEGK